MADVQEAFAAENKAFESRKAELLRLCLGKFAVFKGEDFGGVYDTVYAAYEAGLSKYGNVPFLIRRVVETEQPPQAPAYCLGLLRLDAGL